MSCSCGDNVDIQKHRLNGTDAGCVRHDFVRLVRSISLFSVCTFECPEWLQKSLDAPTISHHLPPFLSSLDIARIPWYSLAMLVTRAMEYLLGNLFQRASSSQSSLES
jgi:hypothetical protein